MMILLMLLLFELEINVLNCNQFSPLVTLINDICLSCYDSSSVSESPTKFSGLPQPHDGMLIIFFFFFHLHHLVVQVLQVHCNNSVKTLGTGSNSKSCGLN